MIDLERPLKTLADSGVRFVLIGGAAMVAQGAGRPTRDVDICYQRTPENIQRLAAALAPFHPRLRGAPEGLPFRFDPETIQRGLNFTLSTDLGDLDLLGEVAGLGFYDAVRNRSETLTLFERECRVLSLDGLILAKRAAGRARDLEVLPELEALRELRKGNSRPERQPGNN
jgi:predicted nucleotidyltransferase